MNIPPQKLNLRDLLIQRHVFEQQQHQYASAHLHSSLQTDRVETASQTGPGSDLRTDFEKDLHQLGREYEVEILSASPPQESLAGRPLQLHLTPRQKHGASFQIRVTGVVSGSSGLLGNLVFKPVSVDISRPPRFPSSPEFKNEADSATDIVAHVYHVLKLLHHPEHFAIALVA